MENSLILVVHCLLMTCISCQSSRDSSIDNIQSDTVLRNGINIRYEGRILKDSGFYKNGQPDGVHKLIDGKYTYIVNFKNGKRDGDETHYMGKSFVKKLIYSNDTLLYSLSKDTIRIYFEDKSAVSFLKNSDKYHFGWYIHNPVSKEQNSLIPEFRMYYYFYSDIDKGSFFLEYDNKKISLREYFRKNYLILPVSKDDLKRKTITIVGNGGKIKIRVLRMDI